MSIGTEPTKNKSQASGQYQKSVQSKSTWKEVESTRADLKESFSFVPSFINSIADEALPGAWSAAKNLRFATNTALDAKLKGLICLAVSSQIPCEMMSYFEEKATASDGATVQEQQEAVMMSAVTRHWSTVLNGFQLDKEEFRKEADKIMSYVKKMMEESHGKMPPEEAFHVKPTTSDEAYKDIVKTLGLVPKFFIMYPKEAVAGAWSEFKGLQLNPYTALSGKQKEIIGLAVSAQIPCEYCVYFHRGAAVLNGASVREMNEAVGVAALARHWSTIFHSPKIDSTTFKRDADQMLKNAGQHRLQ